MLMKSLFANVTFNVQTAYHKSDDLFHLPFCCWALSHRPRNETMMLFSREFLFDVMMLLFLMSSSWNLYLPRVTPPVFVGPIGSRPYSYPMLHLCFAENSTIDFITGWRIAHRQSQKAWKPSFLFFTRKTKMIVNPKTQQDTKSWETECQHWTSSAQKCHGQQKAP